VITVLNTAPPPDAPVACIEIFVIVEHTVELGAANLSTVIVNGEEFEV